MGILDRLFGKKVQNVPEEPYPARDSSGGKLSENARFVETLIKEAKAQEFDEIVAIAQRRGFSSVSRTPHPVMPKAELKGPRGTVLVLGAVVPDKTHGQRILLHTVVHSEPDTLHVIQLLDTGLPVRKLLKSAAGAQQF